MRPSQPSRYRIPPPRKYIEGSGRTHRRALESQSCGRFGKLFMKSFPLEGARPSPGGNPGPGVVGSQPGEGLHDCHRMCQLKKGWWVVLMVGGPSGDCCMSQSSDLEPARVEAYQQYQPPEYQRPPCRGPAANKGPNMSLGTQSLLLKIRGH